MTACAYAYRPQPRERTISPAVATRIQTITWRPSIDERRTKSHRNDAVAMPRASCCGRPLRSISSSAVMKTADAMTKTTNRRSMQLVEDRQDCLSSTFNYGTVMVMVALDVEPQLLVTRTQ